LQTCLVAVRVNALFNHGIAETWLLLALHLILRLLPQQVLAMPPKLCLGYDAAHHQLLMEGLQVPASIPLALEAVRSVKMQMQVPMSCSQLMWHADLSAASTAVLSSA
jgi:hypothetical protein